MRTDCSSAVSRPSPRTGHLRQCPEGIRGISAFVTATSFQSIAFRELWLTRAIWNEEPLSRFRSCHWRLSLYGCSHEEAYAPAPPPAAAGCLSRQVPPLVQSAQRNGFRAGQDDGARDAYYRAGYTPRRDRRYTDAPGYDYRLGPIQPYVDAFRNAYLRGYDSGFYGVRPQG